MSLLIIEICQVLGPTDPVEAPKTSLRGIIYADWRKLGLKAEPNVGDNGVHASASPFEAAAELNNWCQKAWGTLGFGKAMMEAGIPEGAIKDWCVFVLLSVFVEIRIKISSFKTCKNKLFAHCLRTRKTS